MAISVSGGLSGAASGAAIGSAVPVIGTAVGAVVGGLAGLFSGGSDKPKYQPLDIAKVISDARTNAASNYAGSLALEKQFNPAQSSLRDTTNSQLSSLADGRTPGFTATNNLLRSVGTPQVNAAGLSSNPLLSESADRILHNLRLGGALGADVQAQAMQAALEKGGAAGISGSGAARGLVARDLGLTSLGLENQRIGAAQTAGAGEFDRNFKTQQLQLQDFVQRMGLAQGAAGLDTSRIGTLATLVDGRPLPESGLNPGSIASLYTAGNNAQNQTDYLNSAINIQNRNSQLSALLGLAGTAKASGAGSALADLFKSKVNLGGDVANN